MAGKDGSIWKIKDGRVTCRWTLSILSWLAGCFFLAFATLGFYTGASAWHNRRGEPVSALAHYSLMTVLLATGAGILFFRRRVVIDAKHGFVETGYQFILRFGLRRYPLKSFDKVVLREGKDSSPHYEVVLLGPDVTVEAGFHQQRGLATSMAETIANHAGLPMESCI